MIIIHEDDIDKGTKISKWLIGPWNASIKEVEFGIAELNKGDAARAHYHDEVQEFVYVIKGEVEVEVNKVKNTLTEGTLIYFEPTEVHSFIVLSESAKLATVKTPSRPKDKFYV